MCMRFEFVRCDLMFRQECLLLFCHSLEVLTALQICWSSLESISKGPILGVYKRRHLLKHSNWECSCRAAVLSSMAGTYSLMVAMFTDFYL